MHDTIFMIPWYYCIFLNILYYVIDNTTSSYLINYDFYHTIPNTTVTIIYTCWSHYVIGIFMILWLIFLFIVLNPGSSASNRGYL